MDEGGYGSGVLWNIFLGVSFYNVVLSVYQCNLIQLVLFDVVYHFSSDVDFYLHQIEGIYGVSRPNQVVLSRIWFYVAIIHDYMDSIVQ